MKWAPWVIVIYMLAALCWWTYLLYNKNEVIYQQQQAIFLLSDNISENFKMEVEDTYQRQKVMIIGEGIVFTLALISGLFFLWTGYKKIIKNSQNQNNFLLSVTHELKSPLASIKLAFETIKKRNLAQEQNQKISENGIYEVDRLHRQVENILAINSSDHRYLVKRSKTSIRELLKLIRTSRMYSPGEKRVEYQLSKDQADLQINVDIEGVLRIVDNLISNALKYSHNSVQCTLSVNSNLFRIAIADEGDGIAADEKKEIFKRFYRIGNEETRSSKGTGLGLYIVKTITHKNNGSVQVLDNSPHGSIFIAELKIT